LAPEFIVPLEVRGVSIDAGYKHLTLADGREIVTRTLLEATGMEYREHPAPGIPELTGAGVYYGAATTEAPVFSGRRVLVVGGGNSAGQGALYLARYAKEVRIVVRRESPRPTMSSYLIEQIEKTPNIRLTTRTELERVEGNGHVERVALKPDDGPSKVEEMDAVFVFIGTRPRSDWLPAAVLRDEKGFVITGTTLEPRVRAGLEGTARTDGSRDECARRVRGRRHSRRRDEPRGVSRRRRIDGGALRSRVPGADLRRGRNRS
jgi:thioredoxin reductase (NADPH)